jgi:hypothetical protein
MADGFRQIARAEGYRSLLLGLSPTFVRSLARALAHFLCVAEPRVCVQWGYVLQGGCKFGFFELFKKTASALIDNPEVTSRFKLPIYIVASALAETLGTIALCPFEAVRIKQVTQPAFARGMLSGMGKIYSVEGTFGYAPAHTHTHARTHTEREGGERDAHKHAYTHTHTHTYTHTHIHTHTHTYIHTHTYTSAHTTTVTAARCHRGPD